MYYDNFLAETLLYRDELSTKTLKLGDSSDKEEEKGEKRDDRSPRNSIPG